MPTRYDGALRDVIDAFSSLPGIGPKGAQRIAFHLLGADEESVNNLAQSIVRLKTSVRFCQICGNVCETSPCIICVDPRRDKTVICTVQEPKDIMSVEKTGEYRGLYHVLGGTISISRGKGVDELSIESLLERIEKDSIKEVIIATNPTVDGETTALYLAKLLEKYDVNVTRIAYGLPMGGNLDYTDSLTLSKALEGRRKI